MFAGCCAGVAQLVEQLICNQQVGGSNPSTSSNFIDNMGDFPSGQRGQTVNLLAMPSVVRIHHPPPKSRLQKRSAFYFCAFRYSPPRKHPCHCEPVTDVTGVAIRNSHPRTPGRARGPCPTRCCVIGPGRTGSSAPTRPTSPRPLYYLQPSVGATLAVARPTAPLVPLRRGRPPGRPARLYTAPHVKLPVIAKPVRTLAVAIRTPVPSVPFA